jgi:hypothetical protein
MRRRWWCGLAEKTVTLPRVGVIRPAMMRRRVDLPAPFSPRTTVQVPEQKLVEKLRRAAKLP